MKKFRLLSAVVAAFLLVGMLAGCTSGDAGTVVTVNGEAVSDDVFALYLYQSSLMMLNEANVADEAGVKAFWADEANVAAAKDAAVAEAAKTLLKTQEAKAKDITLSSEEIDTINQQIGSEVTQIGSKEEFEKQLDTIFGTTVDAYTEFIKALYLVNKFESTLMTEDEYKIDDAVAKKQVEDTYVKAKHILIPTVDTATQAPLSAEEAEKAKTLADDLYKQIKDGADFDALMNEHSKDPGLATAPDGYEFGKGEMVKEFEDAAYALGIDEVSEPVATSYGYHIIKRVELELTEEKLQQFLPTVTQKLQLEKIDAHFDELKEKSAVEVNEKALKKMEIIQ